MGETQSVCRVAGGEGMKERLCDKLVRLRGETYDEGDRATLQEAIAALAQHEQAFRRIGALMHDPDPYRVDLGPNDTFNAPVVLISDLSDILTDMEIALDAGDWYAKLRRDVEAQAAREACHE